MNGWERLKNLWYISGIPKSSKGFPDEFERGHQAEEMNALGLIAQEMEKAKKAQFIARTKQKPIDQVLKATE